MNIIDSYYTLKSPSEFTYKIQKSKFVSYAYEIKSESDAIEKIKILKKEHHTANHIPFAYLIFENNYFRYSDDGEPSGSGGKPIYDAILKHSLVNVLIAVVRYFGGVKLGVGGLKRAFFYTADECLNNAEIIKVFLKEKISLRFDYQYISRVMNYIEKNNIEITENTSSDIVRLSCNVRLSQRENFIGELIQITNSKISFE